MRTRRFLPLCLLPIFACAAAVPAPESHFGHKIGVDNELLDWDSQPETRATAGLESLWRPQAAYHVRQQGQDASRIFVPPRTDPVDPNSQGYQNFKLFFNASTYR